MANINVVKSLYKKSVQGFISPSFIGAKQYCVSPVRGLGNINNLEEQLLIGANCISTRWKEQNGTEIIVKEFHDEDITENYYILETYKYDEESSIMMNYFNYIDDVLSFVASDRDLEFEGEVATLVNSALYESAEDGGIIINFHATDEIVIEIQRLFFQKTDEKILVSEKVVTQSFVNNKLVRREIITNKLE